MPFMKKIYSLVVIVLLVCFAAQNINAAKDMELSKITAILVIDKDKEEVQKRIINWLIIEGYKVSLKRDEYDILIIEW